MKYGLKLIAKNKYEGRKTFELSDFKVITDDNGDVFISGYVNTKGKADAYGDIPTNFNGMPVYALSRYQKNPILLMNHENETECSIGRAVEIVENEIGLFVKFLLMKSPQTDEALHTKQAIIEGILKAFSIGGRWYFEDEQNPTHLTKAFIHEISIVAIGADGDALIQSVSSKSLPKIEEACHKRVAIEVLVTEFTKTRNTDLLKTIELIRE